MDPGHFLEKAPKKVREEQNWNQKMQKRERKKGNKGKQFDFCEKSDCTFLGGEGRLI